MKPREIPIDPSTFQTPGDAEILAEARKGDPVSCGRAYLWLKRRANPPRWLLDRCFEASVGRSHYSTLIGLRKMGASVQVCRGAKFYQALNLLGVMGPGV